MVSSEARTFAIASRIDWYGAGVSLPLSTPAARRSKRATAPG